jgi:hypothetical protein
MSSARTKLAEADAQHDGAAVAAALRVLRIHRDPWLAVSQKLDREANADSPAGERSWMT